MYLFILLDNNVNNAHIFCTLQEGNLDARASLIVNRENEKISKYDINEIAIAALNALPSDKVSNYLRNLISDETISRIEGNTYEIEVMI